MENVILRNRRRSPAQGLMVMGQVRSIKQENVKNWRRGSFQKVRLPRIIFQHPNPSMGFSAISKVTLDTYMLTDAELELDQINNWRKSDVDFETLAIVETMDPGHFTKTCFMPPIITSSVFNTTVESRLENPTTALHVYSRYSNPGRTHLETTLAKFEGASYALVFSSGCAAISVVFQTCAKGDHVICVQSTGSDIDWLMNNKLPSFGINCDQVFSCDTETILSRINNRTKVIFLECPSYLILEMADIEAISTQAKQIKSDILVVVDNSILTPIFRRPLELGADVIIYSLNKYFAGDSDILMGSILCNSKELYEDYKRCQIYLGAVPSPLDCYLMIRSLKTLPLRMKQHFRSAMKIAHFLEQHSAVFKVIYPGLKSHPLHELTLRQQSGASGRMSFYIKGSMAESVRFIKAVKYFQHGDSFPSDVSSVHILAMTSQLMMNSKDQLALEMEENFISISVGLEGADRLIQDLDQALIKAAIGTDNDML